MINDLYTTSEAADELGVTPRRVRQLKDRLDGWLATKREIAARYQLEAA